MVQDPTTTILSFAKTPKDHDKNFSLVRNFIAGPLIHEMRPMFPELN